MAYNYLESMKEDIRQYLEDKLNEDLWNEDSVTGNWYLLAEALKEFGCDSFDAIERGEQYCDVTIRCYLLNQAIHEVLDEDFEEGEEDE